jgi:hypothetical protein
VREEVSRSEAADFAWLFDLTCAHLPAAARNSLRVADGSIEFAHWLYEHGSSWIYPYL